VDKLVYFSLALLAKIFYILPENLSAAAGSAIGRTCLRLLPARRDLCRNNLRAAGFSESICEDVFIHFGRMLVAVLRMWCRTPRDVIEGVEVVDAHHYRQARARAGHVILVTAHLGNWEKMAWVHRDTSGVPLQVVGRPLDQRGADRFLRELRERGNLGVINKDRGVRGMIRALRDGFELGILVDQKVPPKLGLDLPFFSRNVPVLPVVSLLARKTGAAIVPVFMVRDRDGRDKMTYLPEIRQTGDAAEETAVLTRVMEGFIRRYPEQWFWVHNRWRYAHSPEPVTQTEVESSAEQSPGGPEESHPDQHRTAK